MSPYRCLVCGTCCSNFSSLGPSLKALCSNGYDLASWMSLCRRRAMLIGRS